MEIRKDVDKLPFNILPWDGTKKKLLGLHLKSNARDFKHPSALFPYLNCNSAGVDKYVMKQIRPTGNDLNEEV